MAAGGEIGGDVRAGGMSDRTPARTTNSEAAEAAARAPAEPPTTAAR